MPDVAAERARPSGPETSPRSETVGREPQGAPVVTRLLQLQRAAGNRAVGHLLASRPVVQGLFESEQEKVDKAASTLDVGDIKAISDYSLVKPEDRQKMISALANQGWAGPRDEWALEALWRLYGDKVLDAARANPGNWTMSLARGAAVKNLPAVKALPGKFLGDVKGVALGYLAENEKLAQGEIAKLGGAEAQGPPGPEAAARIGELQEAAKLVGEAKQAQEALKQAVVGGRLEVRYQPDGTKAAEDVPAYFIPNQPPAPYTPRRPLLPPGVQMKTHDEVQAQYDLVSAVIEAIKEQHPGLGALGLGGDDQIVKMGESSPEDARATVLGSLNTLLKNIGTARGRLDGNILYDLKPIHTQLLTGATKGGWNIDWKDPVIKAIADEFLEGHESQEFWVSLGLGTLAAAAFVVASMATFGVAAVAFGVGLGIGAGQAAASWDKAYEQMAAAKTSLSKRTQLVDPSQADMAVLTAIIDTVFVFIDAAGVGTVFKGASRAAARQAMKIATLESVEAAARPRVIAAAVDSLGPAEAIRLSGKRAEELVAIVGKESNAGRRLAELAATDPKVIADLTTKLSTVATLEAVERTKVLGQAFDNLGPGRTAEAIGGWARLESTLGAGALLDRFKSWREGILASLPKRLAERRQLQAAATEAAEQGAPSLRPGVPAPPTPGQATPAEVQAVKELLGETTGVTAERVLPTLAPHLENPMTMLKLVEAGRTAMVEAFEKLATVEARAEYLVAQTNARLAEAGVPPVKSGLKSAGGTGNAVFDFPNWTIVLDKDVLLDSVKAKALFDLMMGKAYHEARHAEQWFKMARYLKGRKPGLSADDLVRDLGIPKHIAEAADKAPMKVVEPDFLKTRAWYESVYGAGKPRRNFVLSELDRLGKELRQADGIYQAAKEQLEQVSKKRSASAIERTHAQRIHDEALRELQRIDKQFQPIYSEYRALPEEVDAWAAEARLVGILPTPPIPKVAPIP